MDIILHIGAHRTASTSFQSYLRSSSKVMAEHGVGFWGPLRLRRRLFHGIIPNPELGIGQTAFLRAQGRLALQIERSAAQGLTQLLVSDENMLGQMRMNIAQAALYPAAGERIARFLAAFQGRVGAVHLVIRDLGHYWPSALAFSIPRSAQVPSAVRMKLLAEQLRDWRDVITDLAAASDVPIFVSTFEQFAGRPEYLMSSLTGLPLIKPASPIWRNQRPATEALLRLPLSAAERARLDARIVAGRWEPFSRAQRHMLQERYADDLFWLRAGADGLAHFMEDPKTAETGSPAEQDFENKGQKYDTEQRLARPG